SSLIESKRNKINPEELIEGAQLSINREDYIDIKETLQNNTNDFPVGICVESRKRIKLDNLTLNLLGMINQKLPQVFISYSRKDLKYKDELKAHLNILERYGLLNTWSCEEIQAGTWDSQIQTELEKADVIVYMVSQNFMASGYIMEQEVAKGIKLVQENPEKKIMCVLVRDCNWQRWSFMEDKFKDMLEKDGKEFSSKDLSKYQFLPYHQYKNELNEPIREEIVALEKWGRQHYDMPSVAFTQIADRILSEVTRRK
uniref:toll/interleukin-1 receptor domain-containing protein n=1 Tax=Persicitalea sp. TaxID=3100273 RepID=UPI003593F376